MNRHLALLALIILLFQANTSWAQRSYKKKTRESITDLAVGRVGRNVSTLEKSLQENPDDTEVLYALALGFALRGDEEKAMTFVRDALERGLPLERFLAGPRDFNKALVEAPAFKALAKGRVGPLLHGPLLGAITDSRARFWVRTLNEAKVEVAVAKAADLAGAVTGSGQTTAARDFTTVVEVSGLDPDTEYFYRLSIGDEVLSPIYRLRTFPPASQPAKFHVTFGGGAGFNPQYERMWDVIQSHNPLAFFALGDNVYIDTPFLTSTQQYCYYRRQSRPEWRRLSSSTPVFAIWDDHDFYTNDGLWLEGRPDDWKIPVWKTFQNNWNNPAYGLGEEHPGCFFATSIADVDFFFLDGRYHRSHDAGTNLGSRQKQWLFEGLKASRAVFKVICSNVPITPGVKPGSKDTWDGFPAEREELFTLIERERISGVFVIAADRHRSDAWRTERKNSYPIYEFQSSRLTNVHTHRVLDGCLFGYNEKCSFGRLTFNTAAPDPEVTYDVVSIDNKTVHSLTLKASQLKYP